MPNFKNNGTDKGHGPKVCNKEEIEALNSPTNATTRSTNFGRKIPPSFNTTPRARTSTPSSACITDACFRRPAFVASFTSEAVAMLQPKKRRRLSRSEVEVIRHALNDSMAHKEHLFSCYNKHSDETKAIRADITDFIRRCRDFKSRRLPEPSRPRYRRQDGDHDLLVKALNDAVEYEEGWLDAHRGIDDESTVEARKLTTRLLGDFRLLLERMTGSDRVQIERIPAEPFSVGAVLCERARTVRQG